MSLFVAFGAKSTVDFREVPELVRAVQSQLLPGCADRPCVGEPRVAARDRLLSEMSGDLRDPVAPACSEDELSTDADHRAILARRDLLMVVAMTGLLASCDGTSSPAGPKGRDAAPSTSRHCHYDHTFSYCSCASSAGFCVPDCGWCGWRRRAAGGLRRGKELCLRLHYIAAPSAVRWCKTCALLSRQPSSPRKACICVLKDDRIEGIGIAARGQRGGSASAEATG